MFIAGSSLRRPGHPPPPPPGEGERGWTHRNNVRPAKPTRVHHARKAVDKSCTRTHYSGKQALCMAFANRNSAPDATTAGRQTKLPDRTRGGSKQIGLA